MPPEHHETHSSAEIEQIRGREMQVRLHCSMRSAYPAGVDTIQELKLDCLEAADDGDGCVEWRSDVERQMMQSISGWHEGDVVKSAFVPLGAVLFGIGAPAVDADMDGDASVVDEENVDMEPLSEEMQHAQMVVAVLDDADMNVESKLRKLGRILNCAPTVPDAGDALSHVVMRCHEGDDVRTPQEDYQCSRCNFRASRRKLLLEHLVHDYGGSDGDDFTLIKYRKQIVTLLVDLVDALIKEVVAVLEKVNMKFETKLRTAAQMLECSHLFCG